LLALLVLPSVCRCDGLSQLNTGSGGVRPDREQRLKQIDLDADWHDAVSVKFEVRRTEAARPNVWVYAFLETAHGWRYQSVPVRLRKDTSWHAMDLALTKGTPDWFPSGHMRDLDDFALSRVVRFGLKYSSPFAFPGRLEIRNATLARKKAEPAAFRIFDFDAPSDAAVGELVEIRFRLDQPYRNPFGPEEADVRLQVKDPKQREFQVLAFYHQDFLIETQSEDEELRPFGAGEWRARFRPTRSGAHTYRMVVSGRYEGETEDFPLKVRPVKADRTAPEDASAVDRNLLQQLDRSTRKAFVLGPDQWVPEQEPGFGGQFAYWHCPLEWSPPRPGFMGLGLYHLGNASQLDRALHAAEGAGKSYPLRVFGNEEFHEVSTHVEYPLRWKDNPYQKTQGGPLLRASGFFSDRDARKSVKCLLRYIYARFGHSPALSHVVLGLDFSIPSGAAQWYQEIGAFWRSLPAVPDGHRPALISLHPQTIADRPPSDPGPAFKPAKPVAGELKRFVGPESVHWSSYEEVLLDISLPDDAPTGMRCAILSRHDHDWWYQALAGGFLRPGDVTQVRVSLARDGEFRPSGHGREWSAYALMELRSPEIRIYSEKPYDGQITLEQIRLAKTRAGSPQLLPPQLAKMRIASPELPAGQPNEIAFELSKAYPNPFDPSQVSVDLEVSGPKGKKRLFPAFFYQAYGSREIDGRKLDVPEGPLEWRARVRPDAPGRHTFRILVRESQKAPIEVAQGRLRASKPVVSSKRPGPLSESARQLLVEGADRNYRTLSALREGKWVPLVPLYARTGQAGYGRTSEARPQPGQTGPLWLANLEWHKKWGEGYLGLGKFNLRLAYKLDAALKEAHAKGLSYLVRLNGNEELHDVSTNISFKYRWADNPLNSANGGPLTKPSAYFENALAIRRMKALVRYVAARYGAFQSAGGFAFANDIPSPGAEAWHQEMAAQFHTLPAEYVKDVISFHPQANPLKFRTHRPKLSFQARPYYKSPPSADAPGKEIQAFTCGPETDWSPYDLAVASFALPLKAPADVRVMLSAKDEDNWWYQALHPAFLRPGDTTTLVFDVSAGGMLTPVGHPRPWTDYGRFRVKDVSLRLFSSKSYNGQVQLASFEFWETPGQDVPLAVTGMSARSKQIALGQAYGASFSLNKAFRNPFDPLQVDIGVNVRQPAGQVRRVSAFFTQDYRQEGKALVPDGAPHWKLRFRPTEEGLHSYEFEVRVDSKRVPLQASGEFRGVPGLVPPKSTFESPFLLRQHDLSYRTQAVYDGASWQMLESQVDPKMPLWHGVLEWTSRWGKYKDLGRYNLEVAWRLEQAIQQAGVAGQSFPLRLSGNMELFNRRKYRWPDNPLNKANGGPLSAPSLYYRSPQALKAQAQLWQYLIARYGELPGVSDLSLAADLAAEGAEDWHFLAGKYLSKVLPPGARLLSYHPQVLTHRKTTILADFERSAAPFRPDTDIEGGRATKIGPSQDWASHGRAALAIRRSFAGDGEAPLVANIEQDWFDFDTLVMDVKLPPEAPHDMRLMVFLKDRDLWYYQNLLEPFLIPGDVTRLVVDLSSRNRAWAPPRSKAGAPSPWDHSKPWTDVVRVNIRQMGIRIFGHKPYNGPIYIDNLQLWQTGRHSPKGPARITELEQNAPKVPIYDKCELTFSLDREFRSPFDTDLVDIRAQFVGPDKKTFGVPAFYYQDYDRKEISQTCRTHDRKERFEVLTPKGAPVWKVRFAATSPGTYHYTITLNGKKVWPTQGGASFEAVPARLPGFVRVAKDKQHFEFSNNQFFYPVGHNLRSPTDGRNTRNYQAFFEQEWHRGTFLYDDYFSKMAQNGLNWARIWQCSWWLGLQWTKKWPGFHGLGWYNLENAWRLDYLLESARKHNIYVQLDTTNHGQYSLEIDTEWAHNPYNANNPVDRGPLRRPREFFNEPAPRKQYGKRVRYTASRWGYSPNIFAWILMTECEFTDDYWSLAERAEESVRHPGLVKWHEFAADLFKRWAPNQIVATHFSHPFRGYDVFASPAIEFVESNTYWQDWKYQKVGGPVANTMWINDFTHRQYLGVHKKPVLVGEFGGDVYKNPPARLDIELHIGSWSMLMLPYGGNTGYWWWPWLHYMDRYGHLKAIVQFMKGEDRRGKGLERANTQATAGLAVYGLQNKTMADLWVYIPQVRVTLPRKLTPVRNGVVTVRGLKNGAYNVEFWDTYAGRPTAKKRLTVQNGVLQVPLPMIQSDIALKVRGL